MARWIWPGQRHRRERDRRPDEPPPLEREQHRGKEKRDQPEQVPGRLADPVRRQGKDEPAHERSAAREPERAQPPAGERARRATTERSTMRL